jgi:energy-converting hydrogenase Eha subunit F
MVIDYSERRQVRKPVPRRPRVWPYVLLIVLLVVAAFILGLGTGRHLYKPGGRFYKPLPQPQQPSTSKQPVSPQPPAAAVQTDPPQQVQQQAPSADKGAPPLTFYNTLQKGNKGLMGTGINAPKEGQTGGGPKPQAQPPATGN